MSRMLSYQGLSDKDFDYGRIMKDKIVRFSKSEDGEVTYIHLITEEIIESSDSIRTLEARVNFSDS